MPKAGAQSPYSFSGGELTSLLLVCSDLSHNTLTHIQKGLLEGFSENLTNL